MSEWTDRIKGHQIWTSFVELGSAIEQALARSGIDAVSIDSLERLRLVLAICRNRLESADPVLLTVAPVSNMANALNNSKNGALAFAADGNATHLVNANANADEALSASILLVGGNSIEDLTAISEAAGTYRATLERYLKEVLTTYERVKSEGVANVAKLSELAAEIAAEKQKIAAANVDFQAQFSASQATRTSEFTAAQTERQTAYVAAQTERQEKYTATASENQALFSAAQEARAKEHTDAQTERKEKFTAIVADYTQKLVEHNNALTLDRAEAAKKSNEILIGLSENFSQKAASILSEINAHKVQVEKLVGVIGNLGVTSGYQKVATYARTALIVWQSLTVLSLAGLIFIAYLIAFAKPTTVSVPAPDVAVVQKQETPKGLTNPPLAQTQVQTSITSVQAASDAAFWQGLATRIFLAIAIGVFAAYAARQGDKFLEMERKNRKLALELEAVGPFIAPLPEEMQNKFRADLGSRSFGVPDGDGVKSDENSPATVLDVLNSKEVREALLELIKRIDASKPK